MKTPPKMCSIDSIIKSRRILITCGTGGVGKTTLSAALALRAACLGKKAAVITIDPAKRLATSLGLSTLGDHPTDLTKIVHQAHAKLKKAGLSVPPSCTGTLAAIMPDTRRTFEDFVNNMAPSPTVAEQIFRNPIFQVFAREFSGTNEYMALERLFTLDSLNQYDCIILDTPPSRNTLAFLDAPKLLARFFEERLIRWLVLPANKIVSHGMRKALGVLERLTGSGFMTNLFEFASALFEIQIGFAANLKKITALLESNSVGFLLVAAPVPETAPELGHFTKSLRDHKFQFDGVALNRSLGYLQITANERTCAKAELGSALEIIEALQAREQRATEALLETVANNRADQADDDDELFFVALPELARDVHSIEDLFHVAMSFDGRTRQT